MNQHDTSSKATTVVGSHKKKGFKQSQRVKDDVGIRSIRGRQKVFYEVVAQVLSCSNQIVNQSTNDARLHVIAYVSLNSH